MAREKKAKELKEKKEQQAKEAKEKREAELKSRQEMQQAAAAARAPSTTTALSNAASSSMAVGNASPSGGNVVGGPPTNIGPGAATRQPPKTVVRGEARDLRPVPQPRSIIYVTGLSPRVAKEEIMRRNEYFGQYGKILKVQLNPASSAVSGPPSSSCTIAYATRDEAEQAILAVDGVVLDGRTLKATFVPITPSVRVSNTPPELEAVSGTAALEKDEQMDTARAMRDPLPTAWDPPMRQSVAPIRRVEVCVDPPAAAAPISMSSAAIGQNRASGGGLSAVPGLESSNVPTNAHVVGPNVSWPTPGSATAVGSSIADSDRICVPNTCAPSTADANAAAACSALSTADISPSVPLSRPLPARDCNWTRPSGALQFDSAALAAIAACPTGSGAEPWSMSGFEALLNGIVSEEGDDEPLPEQSRFARFFKDVADDEETPAIADAEPFSGIKLDGESGAKQNEDWQQGFRALLPNVNISFSPLNIGGLDGLGAPLTGSASAGLVASSAGKGAQPVRSSCAVGGAVGSGAVGGAACGATGNGLSSGVGATLGAASFSIGTKGGVAGLAPAIGSSTFTTSNGGGGICGLGEGSSLGGSLSQSPPSEVSLLTQLSGGSSLLSAQPLPGAQLSSQLQSLLQGSPANGATSNASAAPSARAVGGSTPGGGGALAAGGAAGSSLLQNGDPAANGVWSSGSAGGSCLIPGWLPSEGLLSDGLDVSKDASIAGMKGPPKKEMGAAVVAGSAAAAAVAAGNDRNKPKKRGGTGGRGKTELKAAHK